jgi:DNA processing protein
VIQAAPRSGSLSTARHALELGREVWALPGRIFDHRSAGANLLIRDGASPALDPEQVLESLPLAIKDALKAAATTGCGFGPTHCGPDDRAAVGSGRRPGSGSAHDATAQPLAGRLLELLVTGEPTTAEALAHRSSRSVEQVLAAWLDLEIEGRVGRLAGSRFVKRAAPWARL